MSLTAIKPLTIPATLLSAPPVETAVSPYDLHAEAPQRERFGVHSEIGRLRTVLVCRPGLAHQRLTPGNRAELLFDDVLWVQEAQKDHYDFVLKMRDRDVEVLELHDLLRET